jgi:hypothetical protein
MRLPIHRDTEWRQRDGTVIEIAKMGDGHLANTLRMLERKAQDYQQQLGDKIALMVDEWSSPAQHSAVAKKIAKLKALQPIECLRQKHTGYRGLLKEATKRKRARPS